MIIDPNSAVVAYCAPGLKYYVISALLEYETVREVIEDPAMTGRTDVVLSADPVYTKAHKPEDKL
jgi:hypothetical protein